MLTNNYSGAFFIEIETSQVITDFEMVNDLNSASKRIINHLDHPGLTLWEMNDLSASLKAVQKLSEKTYGWRLLGEGEILFIEQLSKQK